MGRGMESEAGEWESRALCALVRSLNFNLKWKTLEDFEQGNAYDLIFVFKKMALATVGRKNVSEGYFITSQRILWRI